MMITALIYSVKKIATKIALSLISEAFMEWAFFQMADRIVESTATPHDDIWLEKFKEEYKK